MVGKVKNKIVFRGKVLPHETNLILPLFIEVPVQSQ
jgi:hypothetical protein